MRALILGMVLVACGPGDEESGGSTGPSTGSPTTGSPTEPVDCSQVPQLPLEVAERIAGYSGAEDFAFDLEGNYVGADDYGNIVRIPMGGPAEVWSPNFGDTAGTAFLPDGTLAIASIWRGQVERVRKNGGTGTLLGAMSYPNGVTVDGDGVLYVADQNTGEVHAFDTETDERTVLATDLVNPNGLALSPDHRTLYVGSFGAGTVHAIDLDSGALSLFGETPQPTSTTGGACGGLVEGDECFLDFVGLGSCVSGGAGLECTWVGDRDACSGLAASDPCSTEVLGQPHDSICVEDGAGLFCSEVPAEVITACEGKVEDDPCTASGVDRTCRENWEGLLVCDITSWIPTSEAACDGLAANDPCVILDVEGYTDGTCAADGAGLICDPGWYGGPDYTFHGGLDGVQVDACGYVWVTEYTVGLIWRFPPEGGEPELAVETGTFWIPNLHWGSGVGGWDSETLYVQDRFTDELLVIPTGIGGAPTALELASEASP